jgi:XTP/dITP diphosphohydrolase
MPAELVLGSGNRKKLLELQDLFAPLGLRLSTLADRPGAIQVEETGATFAENARLKAVEQARALGVWVLGEDSGLAVDALDGRPGVYSARFAGPAGNDEANNAKLLAELAGLPPGRRTARYVCHMTLSDPRGQVRAESEADCRGRILAEPRGGQGFGYDPLFEIPEYHCTFAELGLAVKWSLSHRSRAGRLLLPRLARLLVAGEWVP